MCEICYIAQVPRPQRALTALEGIVYNDKKYPNGTTLDVSFLSASTAEVDFVMSKATEWSDYANIHFKVVDEWTDGDIRIQTHPSYGSWAYLGTDSMDVSREAPTMNLGWLDQDMRLDDGGTITHEFGHDALAMPHEHQNPFEPIDWYHERVYAKYSGPPNSWDKAKIDHNIINVLNTEEITATPLDRKSNMCYFFDGSLTHSGIGTSRNEVLSDMDKQFVAEQYPYDDGAKDLEPINPELRRFLSHYFMDRYMYRATKAQLLVCLGWLSVYANPNESKRDLRRLLTSEIKKR